MFGVSETAQQAKVPATKHDDLSLVQRASGWTEKTHL